MANLGVVKLEYTKAGFVRIQRTQNDLRDPFDVFSERSIVKRRVCMKLSSFYSTAMERRYRSNDIGNSEGSSEGIGNSKPLCQTHRPATTERDANLDLSVLYWA
jgi:hypothetical protein